MKIGRDLVRIWFFCGAMLPATAQAQFVFVTNNGAITITGYTGSGGAVVTPNTINGLPVTGIGNGAFAFCGSLTSVTIPDSVTNFGAFTFFACSNLASVTISTNVKSIGVSAFDSCPGLTNVNLPAGVTSIGGSAFQNCAGWFNAIIPNGVVSIGNSAFYNCANLTNVAIPASVTNIGPDAFGACASLLAINVDPQNTNYSSSDGILFQTPFSGSQAMLIQFPGGKAGKYTVPNNVAWIGDFAFDSCAALTSIDVSNRVESIGDWAFTACSGLTSVILPGNTTVTIGSYAFESCSKLESLIIPSSQGLRYHSFDGCANLIDVTIYSPLGYPFDGSGAFSDCPNLTSVYLAGANPSFVWNFTNQVATPTAYYLPGASLTDISNLPTALWLPQVQTNSVSFGSQTNQFGFNINWAGAMKVVVEASVDLANPVWAPLGTNTIASAPISGSIYFRDPQWTNYPSRFYRIRGLNVFGQ